MALPAPSPSSSSCPPNSISFNTSLCACNPGYVFNASSKSCTLFQSSTNDWMIKSGVDYSLNFPSTIFSFDSIGRFTQSQAVFLEATFIMLVSWILFCVFVRIPKVRDGASIWFRMRWWISQLDFCFATRHWLDDQKVVKKRKTELGGTFCVSSWILFIGLSAALLYQFISKRSVEIHNVRAANALDLLTFINDMEFNITTISSMSCSHLRGLGSLVSGSPGSIDYQVFPLSTFVNYSCHNTSQGPTITLNCSKCRIVGDDMYISWQFVDLPNNPALAVGFQFNLTSKSHSRKHVNFVSGILKNGSRMDDRPITFRGPNANILKFNLFPRIYRNFHDLRIIQPLLHDYLPGSFFLDKSQLQTSLQRSSDGLINMTIFVNFLSAFIVEIENGNIMGPVGFFADLGGLYAISFAIFFYLMIQCEYRIKRLRNEDSVLRSIRNRTKAQQHWDKLRKYVMYTWGCRLLDEDKKNGEDPLCNCVGVEHVRKVGSLHKRKPQRSIDSISFSKKASLPAVNNAIPKAALATEMVKCSSIDATAKSRIPPRHSEGECVLGHDVQGARINTGKENSTESCKADGSQSGLPLSEDISLSLPPVPDFEASGSNIPDIHKTLEDLCQYNVMLREKLLAAQSMLEALTKRTPDTDISSKCHT